MLRLLCLICLALAAPLRAEPVTVFAAASLKEPLDRLADQFGEVSVAYAGSGTVARQVLQGAPADLVVLANSLWMDALDEAGAIDPDSRASLLGNRLVLVAAAPREVPLTPEGLSAALGDGRLAIGLTTSVPAGQYGRAALEHLGLWSGVADRVAEVDNVRAALALVARGEAPLGVVYATDVAVQPGVVEVARFPEDTHPAIRYEIALITPRGADLLAFLQGPEARRVWSEAGFLPPPEEARNP